MACAVCRSIKLEPRSARVVCEVGGGLDHLVEFAFASKQALADLGPGTLKVCHWQAMARRDEAHAEPLHLPFHALNVALHVDERGPEQRPLLENGTDIDQVERGRLLCHHAAVAVPVVMAVGKAVAREEAPRLGIEAPVAGTQVAHHWLHNLEFAAAELDCLALTEAAQAMFVLRKGQVIVAHVANDLELWESRK